MRIFKTKWFSRFATKETLTDQALIRAVRELDENSFDADLGGGVFKQRVPRTGSGKSSGYRVIICFKKEDLSFFIYGFAKSDQANISAADKRDLKKLAKHLLALSSRQLEEELEAGRLEEIGGNAHGQNL
jgi:hypothetical protein